MNMTDITNRNYRTVNKINKNNINNIKETLIKSKEYSLRYITSCSNIELYHIYKGNELFELKTFCDRYRRDFRNKKSIEEILDIFNILVVLKFPNTQIKQIKSKDLSNQIKKYRKDVDYTIKVVKINNEITMMLNITKISVYMKQLK